MLQQLPNCGVHTVPPWSGPHVPSSVSDPPSPPPPPPPQYPGPLPQKPNGEQQSPNAVSWQVTPRGQVPSAEGRLGVTGATQAS